MKSGLVSTKGKSDEKQVTEVNLGEKAAHVMIWVTISETYSKGSAS